MGKLIGVIISVAAGWLLGGAAGMFMNDSTSITENLIGTTGLIGAAIGFMVILIYFLMKPPKEKGLSGSGVGKTKDGQEMEQYYSSRFVSMAEMRKDPKFMFCLYSQLKERKKDGIPLRAERIGKDTEVNMYKPIHTLVIGTTGSGKTTMIMDPYIQLLSESGSKPSIVISDVKGELYNHNAQKLLDRGYDVQVLDLREPDKSARFNPIERAYDAYQRAHNLITEVRIHRNENPFSYDKLLKIPQRDYGSEWYEFNEVAYPDKMTLKRDMDALKSKLESTAQEDLTDISTTLCPIVGNDPSWAQGAQGLIKAIMLAMLEDSLNPELGLTKEKFNLYNVAKIGARRDSDTPNDSIATLRRYFEGRDKTSECVDLANTVVTNAPNTAKGFLGHVTSSLAMFSDPGIAYLTSGTDIDFSRFADRPSALFIKIPDEKDTRNAMANICITQLYKMLIERANENARRGGEIELPRNCYFILDEFGNLPKIERLKSFITAGRSRKIFLIMAIQDYTQLNSIYGEQDASTIRNNCNIQIFIGTKDAKTREEFSKNTGNIALEMTNENQTTNKGSGQDGKDTKSTSISKNTVQRALVTPDELDHLDGYRGRGEVIINCFGEFTIRSYFTPTFKNDQYQMDRPPKVYTPSNYLDKDAVFYDIGRRNDIILGKSKPSPRGMF